MPLKTAVLFVCLLLTGGCVRVAGTAGYWKQGPSDEVPQSHQAGFDTQQLIPRNP